MTTEKGFTIGIDLGTTKSVMYVYENGAPRVLLNQENEPVTPSFVAFKPDGTILVGRSAKNQAAQNAKNTFSFVKRMIGRRFDDPNIAKMQEKSGFKIVPGPNGDAWVEVLGKAQPPSYISGMLLKKMKEDAERQLGGPVTNAVITVPAAFDDAQREATRQAGEIAGLKVDRIINEPVAAALAYGANKKADSKIAVFDLGGGTFDVSILSVDYDEEFGTTLESKAHDGDTFLGGENFDEAILNRFLQHLETEYGVKLNLNKDTQTKQEAEALQRLRRAAEDAKIKLSGEGVTTADVSEPYLMPNANGEMVTFEYALSRREMEDIIRPLVEKTLQPCRNAMAKAGISIDKIDTVLLAGSQGLMPIVRETVEKFFGKQVTLPEGTPINQIVARGAAIQAAIMQGLNKDVLLIDATALSIGIRLAGGVFYPMIKAGTTIPTAPGAHKDYFGIAKAPPGQPQSDNVTVSVFQGEREMCDNNRFLGDMDLYGTLLNPLVPDKKEKDKDGKEVDRFEIAFNMDANGLLTVVVTDMATGKEMKQAFKPASGLTPEQVEAMKADAAANTEADKKIREGREALAEADYTLKAAEKQKLEDEDAVKNAPADLKTLYEATKQELTQAIIDKNGNAAIEKLKIYRETVAKMGEAFKAASSAATPAAPEATSGDTGPAAPTPGGM